MLASIKKKCYGCGACINICPHKAIELIPDHEGFNRPSCNKEKCTNCRLCTDVCPANGKNYSVSYSNAYALAANDEVRVNSASGGVFYLAAEYTLKNGGVVCGAQYSDDFREVRHAVINSVSELTPLLSSKYVQSDIKDSLLKLEEAISDNKPVLFCGTPCQCAGMRKFLKLKKLSDDKVIVIDLLCHAAPSPKAWKLFIDELILNTVKQYEPVFGSRKLISAKIVNVNQRSKYKGWQPNILLKVDLELIFDDNSVISHTEYGENKDDYPWWYVWLRRNAASRLSCYSCDFACKGRQGDLTIGDFWGVDRIIPGINDSKGLSLVLATSKGNRFLRKITDGIDLKVLRELTYLEAENATKSQKTLSGGWPIRPERELLFSELNNDGFFNAYKKLLNYKPSLEPEPPEEVGEFDIGIVGWYYSGNIGDVLTDWAAYRFFELLGLRVLMISDPYLQEEEFSDRQKASYETVKKYYNISKFRTIDKLQEINKICKRFVVAGGMTWKWEFLSKRQGFYDLGFASDSAVKASCTPGIGRVSVRAYTEEIGGTNSGLNNMALKSSYNFKRFNTIFVRESAAVDIMQEVFGVFAKQIYDPVLFINQEAYEPLLEDCTFEIPKEPYIFYYIFNSNSHFRFINHYHGIAEKMRMKEVFLVPSRNHSLETYCANREFAKNCGFSTAEATIGNWVSLMKNCEYVICNSFHCAMLAIRFNKQFAILELRKDDSRMDVLKQLNLSERLIKNDFDNCDQIYTTLKRPIDWSVVNEKLRRKCSYDINLLIEALNLKPAFNAKGI
ncbi:MAG: Coenzyme F420 hydrogenase/dehydrogenase, beta subunit C-terminal domain [Clostridiales bacterium]|jgi:ferredoxin|nr:Coenzyme F420 hydrogenase/dehydrogenase, beta subunit C-terminal domain [Clostridiales bacterium]